MGSQGQPTIVRCEYWLKLWGTPRMPKEAVREAGINLTRAWGPERGGEGGSRGHTLLWLALGQSLREGFKPSGSLSDTLTSYLPLPAAPSSPLLSLHWVG